MTAHNLKNLTRAALAALSLGILVFTVPAEAMEHGAYTMEILVDGMPLREYASRDTTYIEALAGRDYSIRLSNHTGRRIAIALSVDGLNSIDAKTTSAREAAKWILGPYQTITLDGWQTSSSTARRFFFTTEDRSYGAWLGKTSNLGIISAAVFREKVTRPTPIWEKEGAAGVPAPRSDNDSRRKSANGPRQESFSGKAQTEDAAEPNLSDEAAATGIGRKLDHQVRKVSFDSEKRPATVLELRYEYHDALVKLGVLPRQYARCEDPLSRRERARGFSDMEFAPDPFRADCR